MTQLDIAELAKIHGVENLRFFFPARPLKNIMGVRFTSSDDEQVVVEARAVERFNRVVADGYKMILQPLDETFAYSDFYICDFESLHQRKPDRYRVEII